MVAFFLTFLECGVPFYIGHEETSQQTSERRVTLRRSINAAKKKMRRLEEKGDAREQVRLQKQAVRVYAAPGGCGLMVVTIKKEMNGEQSFIGVLEILQKHLMVINPFVRSRGFSDVIH